MIGLSSDENTLYLELLLEDSWETVLIFCFLLYLEMFGGGGEKKTAKNQGSPTTMQATIVIAQAKMTGKIVNFAKYW